MRDYPTLHLDTN